MLILFVLHNSSRLQEIPLQLMLTTCMAVTDDTPISRRNGKCTERPVALNILNARTCLNGASTSLHLPFFAETFRSFVSVGLKLAIFVFFSLYFHTF